MIKKKNCQSTKRAKIVEKSKREEEKQKNAKISEKLKNQTKNDCHRYKLEARRAVRDYTS